MSDNRRTVNEKCQSESSDDIYKSSSKFDCEFDDVTGAGTEKKIKSKVKTKIMLFIRLKTFRHKANLDFGECRCLYLKRC